MKMVISKREKKNILTIISVTLVIGVLLFVGITFKAELKNIGDKFVANSKEIVQSITGSNSTNSGTTNSGTTNSGTTNSGTTNSQTTTQANA